MRTVPSYRRFWTLNYLGWGVGFAVAFVLAAVVLPPDAPLLGIALGGFLPLVAMVIVGLWQLR